MATGTVNARVGIQDHVILVSATDQDGQPVPGARVSVLGWRGAAAGQAREHFERHGNLVGVYDSAFHRWELSFEGPGDTMDWLVEPETLWAICPITDGSRESVQVRWITKERFVYPVEVKLTSSAATGR